MEDNNEHDPPSDDDMEEEHQVEDMLPPTAGGKRKSRRKTNFLYRYDSLRGSDMDDYFAMADYIKTMTTCLSALLIYHQVVSMQLLMAMMTRMDLRMMLLLHHNWTILHRAIAWLTCAIYLFILDVEDLLFYAVEGERSVIVVVVVAVAIVHHDVDGSVDAMEMASFLLLVSCETSAMDAGPRQNWRLANSF